METTGRFAPSPSGRLHLGNLLCALLVWLSARQKGGRVLLRVEDLDTARCPRRYAAQMEADLRWLGLDWDIGPGKDGGTGPYEQSRRTAVYQAALEKLQGMGLVYPCFCTRAELHASSAPHREDGQVIYAGTCRNLTDAQRAAKTKTPCWRVAVPDEDVSFTDGLQGAYTQNLARGCGDFIIRRADGVYAYQLAVVTDDAEAGVTQVVRGSDLLSSTPRQIWLQRQLGFPEPAYYHVPLLVAPDGRRLSKRERDLDMGALRERYTPQALLGLLAHACGLLSHSEAVRADELAKEFSWRMVRKENIVIANP